MQPSRGYAGLASFPKRDSSYKKIYVVVVVDGLRLTCGGIPVRMASGRTSLISVPSPMAGAALNRE